MYITQCTLFPLCITYRLNFPLNSTLVVLLFSSSSSSSKSTYDAGNQEKILGARLCHCFFLLFTPHLLPLDAFFMSLQAGERKVCWCRSSSFLFSLSSYLRLLFFIFFLFYPYFFFFFTFSRFILFLSTLLSFFFLLLPFRFVFISLLFLLFLFPSFERMSSKKKKR